MSDNMIIHDKLDHGKLKNLIMIKNEVDMNTKKIRVVNGKAGVYLHSNWNEWSHENRDRFKRCFDNDIIDNSVIGWFLHIPAIKGNLPYNDTWKNANTAGTVYSYALNDDMHIILDGTRHTLSKGQGIKFSLKTPHEIQSSTDEQNWACVMCFE